MSVEKNPYTILGLSPDASLNDIKAAYRKLVQRLHPDNNPNPAAAKQFEAATAAYELLTDSVRKRKFDDSASSSSDEEEANAGEVYTFSLQVTPSKRTITPLPEPQVVYLLADITPDPRVKGQPPDHDAHLNLTLVLDRSNSMRGNRIEKVKIAAHQIIDKMNENDIISIVTFNDRAEVVIRATSLIDKPALKANVSMISALGGTEIYQGLSAGVEQIRRNFNPRMVNHIILLTDGHTFGDQDQCIALAEQAGQEGIGISAMGLGHDWNDEFLDTIASLTGGNSVYINSAAQVVRFLENQVRSLINGFAERVSLSIAPDPNIQLESAFKLSPHPQPLTIEGGHLILGSLQVDRHISVLLQLQIPSDLSEGPKHLARLVAEGDILSNEQSHFVAVEDIQVDISETSTGEYPPASILDALSKLTLYRLQERASEALEGGDVAEATRRLENLATRLLAMGQEQLAGQALAEARRVAHTSDLSSKGRKTLKYQTRYLLTTPINEDEAP